VDEEQNPNIGIDQNVDDKFEENLTESLEEGNIDERDQDIQSLENHKKPDTEQIQHPENLTEYIFNFKKNKNLNSNNNPALQLLEIMKENSALRKLKQGDKKIKPEATLFENMDETDLFFLSMSKMTKQLPQVEQAKIKLALSNSVLQAEIRNTTKTIIYPVPPEIAASSFQYSSISHEKSQISHDEEETNKPI